MRVSNVRVSDLEESVKASKYPMSISPDSCTTELTKTAQALAQSGTRTSIVSTHSIDGSKALKATYFGSNTDTYTYTTSVQNDKTFTKICFWAYVENDFTQTSTLFAVNIGGAVAYVQNVSLKAGWNYVEMNERNNANMLGVITGFTFPGWNVPSTGIIVDRVTLK